ncbi:MAG: YkgJ family cysteine cluster protein [Nitrosotalea sp.]
MISSTTKQNSDLPVSQFYNLCSNCTHQGCCTNFAAPLVFENDLENLRQINKAADNYIKDIQINNHNLKTIRKKDGTNNCIFWDNDIKKCGIYKNRPFDCSLYPFDIHFINGKYRWVVYSCNPQSNWNWTEDYLKTFESDPRFLDIISNIESFSDLNVISTLVGFAKETTFVVLREVDLHT